MSSSTQTRNKLHYNYNNSDILLIRNHKDSQPSSSSCSGRPTSDICTSTHHIDPQEQTSSSPSPELEEKELLAKTSSSDFMIIALFPKKHILTSSSYSYQNRFKNFTNMNQNNHYRRLLYFILSSFLVCLLCGTEAAFASSSQQSRRSTIPTTSTITSSNTISHDDHNNINKRRHISSSYMLPFSRSFINRGGASQQQQERLTTSTTSTRTGSSIVSSSTHQMMSPLNDLDGDINNNKMISDNSNNGFSSSSNDNLPLPRTDITCIMQQQPRVNGYSNRVIANSNNNKNIKNNMAYPPINNNINNNNIKRNNEKNMNSDINTQINTDNIINLGIDIEQSQQQSQLNRKQRRQQQQQNPSHRQQHVEFVAETQLPTDLGLFQLRAYRAIDHNNKNPLFHNNNNNNQYNNEPCVLYYHDKPPFNSTVPVPVRIHDQCLTSEVFGSRRCDCKEQLNMALKYIKEHGGFIIYLQQEGRGIGLTNKIAAYALQDHGLDTVDANVHLGFPDDAREYNVVPSILHDMIQNNDSKIRLMTNNPRKTKMLQELGIIIDSIIPMVIPKMNPYNSNYMKTKISRMDHMNMGDLLLADPNNILSPPSSSSSSSLLSSSYEQSMRLSRGSAAENLAVANGMMAPRKKNIQIIVPQGGSQENEVEMDNNIDATSTTPHATANGVQDNSNSEMTPASESISTTEESNSNDVDATNIIGIEANEDGYCLGKQSVIDAIDAMRRGEMIVVVDDLDRENEGDFIMAANLCTPEIMATMIQYSSGVVCIAMDDERLQQLNLPPMIIHNEDPKNTAFTISVDATKEYGITTGISAKDRCITVQMLSNPKSKSNDFHRPGHIFPLRAMPGGVLERNGHTEAAIDFCKLANKNNKNNIEPAGLLCEIVSQDHPTEMMRLPEIIRFCRKHNYVLTSIADLIQYRKDIEKANK